VEIGAGTFGIAGAAFATAGTEARAKELINVKAAKRIVVFPSNVRHQIECRVICALQSDDA